MASETTMRDRIRGLSLAGLLLLTGGACAVCWLFQTGGPFGPDVRSVFYRSGMAIPVLADEGFAMIGLVVCAFFAIGSAGAVAGATFLLGRTGVRVTAGIACLAQLAIVGVTLGWMFAFVTVMSHVGDEPTLDQPPPRERPGFTAEIAAEAIADFRRAMRERRGRIDVAGDAARDVVLLHGPGIAGEAPTTMPALDQARTMPGFVTLPPGARQAGEEAARSFTVWPEGEVVWPKGGAPYTRLTMVDRESQTGTIRVRRTQKVAGGDAGDPYSYALVITPAPAHQPGQVVLFDAGYRVDVLVFRDFDPDAPDDDAAMVERFVATVVR